MADSTSARARKRKAERPDLSASEIAAELGCDRRLVHEALKHAGDKAGRPRKQRTPAERKAEVARLKAQLRRAAAES